MRRRSCHWRCIPCCAGEWRARNGARPAGRACGSSARERRAEAEALLERIRAEGPSAASDLEEKRGRSGWWQWGDAKQALEWLFWTGRITTATRRGSFERVYDLSERVIPAEIRALPTPNEKEAQRALIERAARALGVATEAELRDYFRLGPHEARAAIESLVEAGALAPVEVPGWARLAWLHRDARRPRRIYARSLLRALRSPRLGAFAHIAAVRFPLQDRDLHAGGETTSTATTSCLSFLATGSWAALT